MEESRVVFDKEVPWTELGGGARRKVLAYNESLMLVLVQMDRGGVGSEHTHPHHQSTYVKRGRFRFTIDGKPVEVCEGDTIAFAPNVLHGTVCLEAGELVDVFTPMRKDFV